MNTEVLVLGESNMDDAKAMATARQIGDTLEAAYPGWLWYVEVRQGIAVIKTMHADPTRGYRLKLMSDFYSGSALKADVIRAGGELLERLNLPRRRADWEAIHHQPGQKVGYLQYEVR